jgi:signal transduction histidine kinase
MRLNVRAKQVAGVTGLVGAVVVALSVLHLGELARVTLAENQARGDLLANAVFHRAYEVVAGGGDPRAALQADRGVAAILESSVFSPNVTYAAIADENGIAVAHSDPQAVGQLMPRQAELKSLLALGTVGQLQAIYSDAGGMFEVRTPLLIEGRTFGSIRIGVSMLLARRDLVRALVPALYTALIALGLAAFVAGVLARSLLKPVLLLRSGLSRLGRGEFGVTLDLPQRDEFGELGSFFNTVSAQVSADRHQLAGQKATLESLIERFEEAVAFFGPHGELLFANPAMLPALPPNPIGARASDLLPASHPYRQIVERCLETHGSYGPQSVLVPVPGQNGALARDEERLVMAHAIDSPEGGQAQSGVMLVARDLASLSEVQSTINLSQRLAALGRLTSGVAHEIKNPLNAMGIHVELIRQQFDAAGHGGRPVDQEAARASLAAIADSLRRLDDVVQVFLKFTRPAELNLQSVSVAEALEHARSIVDAEAKSRGIVVEFTCPRDLPAIRADASMIEQAFLNLALNACQAMPNGGRLRLSASSVPGRQVQILFEDSGNGIAPEHLDKVFNLYFTTKEGGSGIGLSMVYRTVQLHDGEIEVHSVPRHGTTFKVLLPQA